MGFSRFLRRLETDAQTSERIRLSKSLPEKPAEYSEIFLSAPIRKYLKRKGIESLYSHQAEAIKKIRNGNNVVTTTKTSSGKTLIFNIPVLESIAEDSKVRALYLFPTNSLANDQLVNLKEMIALSGIHTEAETYTGQTSSKKKKWIRKHGHSIVLTNPDELHCSLIPWHFAWNDYSHTNLFEHLRFVIVDEVHVYRGLFGAQVSHVLHRLRRIAEKYGSRPQFVFSSATIANPIEHCQRLAGVKTSCISIDGSYSSQKHLVLWQTQDDPSPEDWRDSSLDAIHLCARLFEEELRCISFVRSRILTGTLSRRIWQALHHHYGYPKQSLKYKVQQYNGDLEDWKRHRVEADLRSGACEIVVTTNALELGINIGSLDVAIIVGYPGSLMEFWQEAGRAGRGVDEGIIILLCSNDPTDQYLLANPNMLFEGRMEYATLDRANPYILDPHLFFACGDFSESYIITDGDILEYFGKAGLDRVEELAGEGAFERIHSPSICARCNSLLADGECSNKYCSNHNGVHSETDGWMLNRNSRLDPIDHSIRMTERDEFVLFDMEKDSELGANIDRESLNHIAYPGAIYVVNGRSYRVEKVVESTKRIYVSGEQRNLRTFPSIRTTIKQRGSVGLKRCDDVSLSFGSLDVCTEVEGFREFTYAAMHEGKPTRNVIFDKTIKENLHTTGLWIELSNSIAGEISAENMFEAAHGFEHAVRLLAPGKALCCDRDVLGITIEDPNGKVVVYVYDNVPGGAGISEKLFTLMDDLLLESRKRLTECPCHENSGCPMCMQVRLCDQHNENLNKKATLELIDVLREKLANAESIKHPRQSQTESSDYFFVYIIRCKNNAYYVGYTHNLHYRIKVHDGKGSSALASRYVSRHGFDRLLYFELHDSLERALRREKELKNWSDDPNMIRAYKEYLVQNMPEWKMRCFENTWKTVALLGKYFDSRESGEREFAPLSPREWSRLGDSDEEDADG